MYEWTIANGAVAKPRAIDCAGDEANDEGEPQRRRMDVEGTLIC